MSRHEEHWLEAQTGSSSGRRFSITKTGIRIGRHPSNEIVVDDLEVSGKHARIYLDDNGLAQIQDSSSNGTYVNSRRFKKIVAALSDGDSIEIANPKHAFKYSKSVVKASDHRGTAVAKSPSEKGGPLGTLVAESPTAGAQLQLILDRYAVENIALNVGETTIGKRSGASRVIVDHPTVSDTHAKILLSPEGRAELIDLRSTNGTYLNGDRIEKHLLRDGDLIRLGACERLLLFRDEYRPKHLLKDISLDSPIVTVGRDKGNNVRLDHPAVSGFHAEIHRVSGGIALIDKNSTNGTFINGLRIRPNAPRLLDPTDRITIGAVQLVFDGERFEQQLETSGVRIQASHLVREKDDRGKPIKDGSGRPVRILNDVSISIEPRELVGLLGPAGSGKTTLMHALNGFHPAERGSVLLNDANLYKEFSSLRASIGYVPQKDILHTSLTIYECLYFAARLRLPTDYLDHQISNRVMEVIGLLNLSERVNVPIRNLSGGQQKRVSVGIELLSKPGLLFLDEPTAGQDPLTEMNMMQLFRQIANKGSTIIVTTHLLGSFSLLDKVAVLVSGRLAFFGPSQKMLPYFNSQRPHEVYERLQEKNPEQWAEQFIQSGHNSSQAQQVSSSSPQSPAKKEKGAITSKPGRQINVIWRQFVTLLRRQFTLKLRSWTDAVALLLPIAVIGLVIGFMAASPNQTKTLFIMIFSSLWFGCSGAVREVVDEEALFRRERQTGLHVSSYLFSKLTYLAVICLVQSILFISLLSFFGGGIQGHYLAMIGITWFVTFHGALIGLLISSLAPDAEKALLAFPLVLIPQLLLAGLFMPINPPKTAWYPIPDPASGVFGYTVAGQLSEARKPMPPNLEFVSRFMVSRWGLEALADLCIHDVFFKPLSRRDVEQRRWGYFLVNDIGITAHPNDPQQVQQFAIALEESSRTGVSVELPSEKAALTYYFSVLGGFTLAMVGFIAMGLNRKARN